MNLYNNDITPVYFSYFSFKRGESMKKSKSPFFWLNDIKVRDKLFLLYILCVLIPIVFTNIVFCYRIMVNTREQQIQNITLDLRKIQSEFRKIINESIILSHTIYTDRSLNELLEATYLNSKDYFNSYINYLKNMRGRYIYSYQNIHEINIYTNNPSVFNSAGCLKLTKDVIENCWYQKLQITPNQILLHSYISEDYSGTRQIFSIIRKLDYYSNKNQYEKILKIDLQFSAIAQIFEDRRLDGQLLLVDDSNRIIYDSNNRYMSYTSHEFSFFDESNYNRKDVIIKEQFQNMDILNGWKVVGIFSEKAIMNLFKESIYFVIILAFINLSFATFIIYLISKSFYLRIRMLSQHMIGISNENFELIDEDAGQDEIGQLFRDFNRMSKRIKGLIQDVYQADIQRKNLELERQQAQLNSLQSQINPHFLFNTLETIRMRSIVKGETETAEIIKYLSKTFRRALSWDNDMITVKEEVEFAENFLKIQQYRFDKKINYIISMDQDAANCRIPKMSIQPLIENASIHGIEKIRGDGTIKLDINVSNNLLNITVKDNGIGIPEKKLAHIKDTLKNKEKVSKHVGIANVYWRLHLYYGSDFKFSIESQENVGTEVSFSIPIIKDPVH